MHAMAVFGTNLARGAEDAIPTRHTSTWSQNIPQRRNEATYYSIPQPARRGLDTTMEDDEDDDTDSKDSDDPVPSLRQTYIVDRTRGRQTAPSNFDRYGFPGQDPTPPQRPPRDRLTQGSVPSPAPPAGPAARQTRLLPTQPSGPSGPPIGWRSANPRRLTRGAFRLLTILPQSFARSLEHHCLLSSMTCRCDKLHCDAGYPCQRFHCELEEYPRFSDAPPYQTVSYHWGYPEYSGSVHIVKHDITVGITRNGMDLLRNLQHSNSPRVIWIDAVCINQDNAIEKASQVSIMGQLYFYAERCIAYLGDHDDTSRLIFKLAPLTRDVKAIERKERAANEALVMLRKTDSRDSDSRGADLEDTESEDSDSEDSSADESDQGDKGTTDSGWLPSSSAMSDNLSPKTFRAALEQVNQEFHRQVGRPLDVQSLLGLRRQVNNDFTLQVRKQLIAKFMERPWFHRPWVVQEALLSQRIILQCEKSTLDFADFDRLVVPTDSKIELSDLLSLPHFSVPDLRRWYNQQKPQAEREDLKKRIQKASPASLLSVGRLGHLALFNVLYATKGYQCKDRRDRLFALLSLFEGSVSERLRPDYDSHVTTIVLRVVRFLRRSKFPALSRFSWGQVKSLVVGFFSLDKSEYSHIRKKLEIVE